MPARGLRHLAADHQLHTYTLTLAAATAAAAVSLRQAQKPLRASTVTVASVVAFKAKLLTVLAATAVVGSVRRTSSRTLTAATQVQAAIGRFVSLVRRAVTTLLGSAEPGGSASAVGVEFTPVVFVEVTVGPL